MIPQRPRAACHLLLGLVLAVAACERASQSTSPPPDSSLPGPEVRARLDALADCWMRIGPPTEERAWRRIGGLCHRTFHRPGSAGELTLSMVFPQGPDGPIQVTGGYARFEARQGDVQLVLRVRVPADGSPAGATIEVSRESSVVASLGLHSATLPALGSGAAFEHGLHDEIRRANDPTSRDLSRRQECRVLPPADPGQPGGGQQCDWVATTPAEREAMAAAIRKHARGLLAWVTQNRDRIHAMANELFPFAEPSCAERATAR